jgi:hypothetical protein
MGSYNCPLSSFCQLFYFLVFGSDYQFFIDWITHNPFCCMAWNEADTNLSGRLSSSKTHHPLPLLVGEILRFVYAFAGWLCVYVSVQFLLKCQKKPFSCTMTCEYIWRISMIGSWRNRLLILSVIVVLTSCVVVNL